MTKQLAMLISQNPLDGTFEGPGAFQPLEGTGANAGGTPFESFFSVMIGFFTLIGGLMFLMYFLTGAMNWLSSGGDKGKVESARKQLTNSAIGLIIVILTQAIVGIVSGVLGLNILNPAAALSGLWN